MIHKGGQTVGAGTYWNMANGERTDLDREGVLPGEGKTIYIKAPGAVMLLAGPVLGLAFAVFLPFIGIAMTLSLAIRKVVGVVTSVAARSVTFGWRPIEAYLAGKRKKAGPRRKGPAGRK